MQKTAIHWFRRDLRTADNTALHQATSQFQAVYPLFILDDNILQAPDMGAARISFLLQSLEVLSSDLASLGYPLTIRRGQPIAELLKFCRETGAQAVFCNRDYEPYCHQRDAKVFNELNTVGVGFECFKDAVFWEVNNVSTQADKPYTVFTSYAKAWRSRAVPTPRPPLKSTSIKIKQMPSLALPKSSAELGYPLKQTIFAGGEHAAVASLRRFLEQSVLSYGEKRDFPAIDGTSRLSPHLHFGTINVRTVWQEHRQAVSKSSPEQRNNAEVFVKELIWREFYLQILANFPRVAQGSFRPEYDALRWEENEQHFQAWCAGMTGYPIVDAAMRCLNATGWMHNRNRMIVAMFLCKDLLLPWQWGERYFMRQLVDGDLAANNGGWQWSAGTGTDAAPYFRIFNPTAQAEKFDPNGAFVRRWIPELAALSGRSIHRPWDFLPAVSSNYPRRLVIHEEQRPKCLALYQGLSRFTPQRKCF